MTTEHQASRTLVKSPPELWAECSDAGSLARHIGEFGEIRITRLEPEKAIAWEAEHAVGTVEIEPSGWGTKVTLTAQAKADGVGDQVGVVAEVEDPAASILQEESVAIPEGARESAPDPPATQPDPIKEEDDATVEETVAESDPAVAADPVLAGGRWKRLIARSRGWFRSSSGSPPTAEQPSPAEAAPNEVDVEAGGPVDEAAGPVEVDGAESSAPVPEALDAPEPPAPPVPEALDAPEPPAPPVPEPPALPALEAPPQVDPAAILAAALDSLGQAHHRPFSRA